MLPEKWERVFQREARRNQNFEPFPESPHGTALSKSSFAGLTDGPAGCVPELAFAPGAPDRLFDPLLRLGAVAPVADLGPLAGLEILVVREEMLNLLQ